MTARDRDELPRGKRMGRAEGGEIDGFRAFRRSVTLSRS